MAVILCSGHVFSPAEGRADKSSGRKASLQAFFARGMHVCRMGFVSVLVCL